MKKFVLKKCELKGWKPRKVDTQKINDECRASVEDIVNIIKSAVVFEKEESA